MPEDRFDLREIARSALADMPEHKRAAFMAEMLSELRGPKALEILSKARAVVSLRMQKIIDERFPLHELAAVYDEPAAVHARVAALWQAVEAISDKQRTPVVPEGMTITFIGDLG